MMTVEDVPKSVSKEQSSRSQLKLCDNRQYFSPFEEYAQKERLSAEMQLKQIAEVTGVTDERVLITALDNTYKSSSTNSGFDTAAAIEFILESANSPKEEPAHFVDIQSGIKSDLGFGGGKKSGDENADPNSTRPMDADPLSSRTSVVGSRDSKALDPPPNSPTSEGNNFEEPNKALPIVDLTGSSGNADQDLEKAIKLSLEDVQKKTNSFGVAVSQEDQEISRALEASLLESQSGAKRKRGDHYTDPVNPHERERHGLWPVGLKNVGQTCWFSAVIQSLFHLPVFRNLVLNFVAPEVSMMQSTDNSLKGATSGAVSSSSTASNAPSANSNDAPNTSTNVESMEEDAKKKPGEDSPNSECSVRTRRIIEFMLELRKLFALMTASKRKYVDPSKALEILKGTIGSGNNVGGNNINYLGDNQQDVSEFTFIVLEWIEEALKVSATRSKISQDSAISSSSAKMEDDNQEPTAEAQQATVQNPLRELFYGNSLVEGLNNGEPFKKEETFGQYQLRVNGFKDIHESLENATAHEFFDSSTTAANSNSRSGQEHWFTSLPPVLFFSLSRFHFNHQRRLAEKIHNRLEFPQCLFMDRYLVNNKMLTRQKREEVRSLREQRTVLKAKLDGLMFYKNTSTATHAPNSEESCGNGNSNAKEERTMALPQLFRCVINFASDIRQKNITLDTPSLARDVRMSSPCEKTKNIALQTSTSATIPPSSSQAQMQVDNEDNIIETTDVEMASEDITASKETQEVSQYSTETNSIDQEHKADAPVGSYTVTDEEFAVLKNCLTRWQAQADSEMQSLQSSIHCIDTKMNEMYEQNELKTTGYRLHAVMVHEGNVDSGHYWAYVYDPVRQIWLKFNDNTVSEASLDELQKESFGGHFNTSAYSLVYVQADQEKALWQEKDADNNNMEEGGDDGLSNLLSTLPSDLVEFVARDNEAFVNECRQWDRAQEEQLEKQQQQQSSASASGTSQPKDKSEDVEFIEEKLGFVNTHSKLSAAQFLRVLQQAELKITKQSTSAAEMSPHQCLEEVLNMSLDMFANRYEKLRLLSLEKNDYRLESFVLYLMKNEVTMSILQLAVCEHLSLSSLENRSAFAQSIHNAARSALKEFRAKHQVEAEQLVQWHKAYHKLRLSAHYFVRGARLFLENNLEEALKTLTLSYTIVIKTSETQLQGKFKALHQGMLLRLLCSSLEQVNDACIFRFKTAEEIDAVLNCINNLILPAMYRLQGRGRKEQEAIKQASSSGNKVIAGTVLETMERVGNNWCLLLGDQMPPKASERIADIVSAIVDPPMPADDVSRLIGGKVGADLVDQDEDLTLADTYREVALAIDQRTGKEAPLKT